MNKTYHRQRKLLFKLCESPAPLNCSAKIISINKEDLNVPALRQMDEERSKLMHILKVVNNEMEYNYSFIDQFKRYFDKWYIFQKIISNSTQNYTYKTDDPISVKWISYYNNNNVNVNNTTIYEQTVIRFETIMLGTSFAMLLLSEGIERFKLLQPAKVFFDRCYSILKTICMQEIKSWGIRDESLLPFECTYTGCEILCKLCLVVIQRCTINPYINNELFTRIDDVNDKNFNAIEKHYCKYIEDKEGTKTIEQRKKLFKSPEFYIKLLNWNIVECNIMLKLTFAVSSSSSSSSSSDLNYNNNNDLRYSIIKLINELLLESQAFIMFYISILFESYNNYDIANELLNNILRTINFKDLFKQPDNILKEYDDNGNVINADNNNNNIEIIPDNNTITTTTTTENGNMIENMVNIAKNTLISNLKDNRLITTVTSTIYKPVVKIDYSNNYMLIQSIQMFDLYSLIEYKSNKLQALKEQKHLIDDSSIHNNSSGNINNNIPPSDVVVYDYQTKSIDVKEKTCIRQLDDYFSNVYIIQPIAQEKIYKEMFTTTIT